MSISSSIVDRLKDILRTNDLTYQDLAKGIGMSEAAVKRAFAQRAFSLKRLDQISSFLRVSPSDLLGLDVTEAGALRMLTEAQELLLGSDEKLMCFFYLLATRHTLGAIKASYRFSDPEMTRFLIALDREKLIRLDPGNRFKVLVAQDFYWRKGGILDSYYSSEIRRDFVDHIFTGSREQEVFTSGQLSDASLEIIRRKLRSLEDEVRDMIRLDTRYAERKSSNVTLYCSFRPWTLPVMKRYLRP